MPLLWLLLQYKAHPRTKPASRPRKGQPAKTSCWWCFRGRCGVCGQRELAWRQLRLKRAGMWGTQPPWLVRCVTGFSLFAFCGLHCWLLQCQHLWFVVVLFGFGCGVCSVGFVFFFPAITRDELAACEMWAI